MARCSRCGKDKPRDAFFADSRKKNGLQGWCIACKNIMAREYNAKRRGKIRAWEREHAPSCVDCGEKTSFNGKRVQERCDPCHKSHARQQAVERTRQMLALRAKGLLNYEIAERFGVSTGAVAQALSRARLKRYGLLAEREESPWWQRAAA